MRKIIYLALALGFIYSCKETPSGVNESTPTEKPSPDRFADIGTHRVGGDKPQIRPQKKCR